MNDRLAISALDWWHEAGVDCIVEDRPHDWLARSQPADAAVSATVDPAPAALPATLDGLRRWLLTDPSVPGPPTARLDAAGDPAAGPMVVLDMPEPRDHAAGRLLDGAAGELFDAMAKAMGLARDRLYLAPLSPARPAAGRLDAPACAALGRLMRHHVALAAPRRLLLMGDAAVRALLDLSCAEARGRVHMLAAGGRRVPTIATFHPRFLVQAPARKAAAWADLKLFMDLD